ncbi:MAG TPA: hypothetical protein VGL72_20395 [Bryobacteraceae bacterium]|jgi:hypothetical protein
MPGLQNVKTGLISATLVGAVTFLIQPLMAQSAGDRFSLTPTYADQEQPATIESESSDDELTRKTLNPMADLISVPFQYDADFNIGPRNATRQYLTIQPVIPISLNQDWNLIVRTIIPVVNLEQRRPGIFSANSPLAGDPIAYNIEIEPDEGLIGAGFYAWVAGPALRTVEEYVASVKRYPNPPAPNITDFRNVASNEGRL